VDVYDVIAGVISVGVLAVAIWIVASIM